MHLNYRDLWLVWALMFVLPGQVEGDGVELVRGS